MQQFLVFKLLFMTSDASDRKFGLFVTTNTVVHFHTDTRRIIYSGNRWSPDISAVTAEAISLERPQGFRRSMFAMASFTGDFAEINMLYVWKVNIFRLT